MKHQFASRTRRRFLQASAAGLAMPAVSAKAAELPKVKFSGTDITRLVIGSNPLYGYSHFNPLLSRMMREWMTPERRLETLQRAEQAGINTWQVHYASDVLEDLRRYREAGGKMNLLLLGMGDVMKDYRLLRGLHEIKPLGVAHHGNMTDDLIRDGHKDKVQDWCRAARDAGLRVGVSTHNPSVVDLIEEEDWDIDYFMTCMYRITRSHAEARAEYDEAPVGEIYMERDPERMLERVRATRKPCFAFKVLGAGRRIGRPAELDDAFRLVLERIKPTDAMIVGMFPKYKDEITDNVNRVAKFGRVTS